MTGFKPVDAEQLVRDEATTMNHAEDTFLPLAIVNSHSRTYGSLMIHLHVCNYPGQRPLSAAPCIMFSTNF